MSLLGGRGGRSDDWSTPHLRARARAAERLDGPIDPAEEAWLDDHLDGCAACTTAAADYASQRLELRALRDRPPLPPRDLWARTAAAIEHEARSQPRRRRRPGRSLVAPYAMLAGALVVAVVVTSSLIRFPGPSPTASVAASLASGTGPPNVVAETPIPVEPGSVAYLTQGSNGEVEYNHFRFTHVCGPTTKGCPTSVPTDSQSIGPVSSPDAVFGAVDRPLVVVSHDNTGSGGKIFAIAVASQEPTPSPSPFANASPTATPTPPPTATPTPPGSAQPTETASPSASAAPASPPPSAATVSAPPASPQAVIEIARDLTVLDTTAAYAADGSAFAFTARPSDGSQGPDIYRWRVGDAKAVAVTSDHRSVFGSWAGDSIVGSTVTPSVNGRLERPVAFLLPQGATEPKLLSSIGLAWRPVVDPTGRTAVYWSGLVDATADGTGWSTAQGRLVVGRWDDVTASVDLGPDIASEKAATPSAGAAASTEPSPDASATAADDDRQPTVRSETTIETGPLTDWDARWTPAPGSPCGSRIATIRRSVA